MGVENAILDVTRAEKQGTSTQMTDLLTVLITDMEGSTAFIDRRGDESAMGVLRTHERLIRREIALHHGREIKSMGDGFMVTFEDASEAVRCALAIGSAFDGHNASRPDEPIRVRAGVNHGPVIFEGGDIYGTTVNAASRIVAKARSGQVLVSESVKESAGGDWSFVDRGLFWLKGLRERWRLFEATRRPLTAATDRGDGTLLFVDREDERAALRVYVDEATDGRGGFVLLGGDPGVGKTRLAEEIGVEGAARGMRLFTGRCYEATRAHPFAPFIDILEQVERELTPTQFRVVLGEAAGEIARLLPHLRRRFPDIPPAADLPAEQERRYLFASLGGVLEGLARERPLFVHLDDVHLADESTLLFLEQLGPGLVDLPMLIVATCTNAGLASSSALQATIDNLQRARSIERLIIKPLEREHVAEFLSAVGATPPPDELTELLYRETEGNAFFMDEVVRHLIEQDRLLTPEGAWREDIAGHGLDVPESVRLTVGRRINVLGTSTRQVLAIAAVVGRDVSLDLIEVLHEGDSDELLDALDDAERAGLITSTDLHGDVRFRFSHELIRLTLVGDVSLTRRQLLHVRVADAIEQVYASALHEHAADIAYHLVQAGRRADRDRTIRFLILAGEAALAAAAYEDASRHFDRALSLLDPTDHAQRAPVLERLATAERSLGQPDDAIATWNEALDAYEALGAGPDVARLCLAAGNQITFWRRNHETLTLVERGMHALGNEDSPVRAGLIALRAIVAGHRGDYAHAETLFAEALELARRHDDDRILGMVLYSKATNHFQYVEHRKVVEFGSESIELLRRSGELWNLANVLGFVGQSLGFLGRFDEAAAVTEGTKALAERLGNWTAYIYADRARAWRHLARAPDARMLERDGERDLALGNKLGYGWMSAVGYTRMSFASFVLGRWDEAIERARESARYERGAGEGHIGRLVLLHAYAGHRDEAIALFDELRPRFPRAGEHNRFGLWDSFLAAIEGMALIGERDAVAELYELVRRSASHDRLFRGWDYRLHETVVGIAATCARRWDDAEAHFENARRLAKELPYPLEQPEANRFYAHMLIDRDEEGDRAKADGLLAEAVVMYERLEMRRHVALVRDMLAQIA